MHEYGIVQSLLDRVEVEVQRRGASAVRRIEVRLGELSGVDPDLLRAAYRTFRERSVCADAALDLVTVPALWSCPGCGSTIAAGSRLRCEVCGLPARLVDGEEIVLQRIEMEVS